MDQYLWKVRSQPKFQQLNRNSTNSYNNKSFQKQQFRMSEHFTKQSSFTTQDTNIVRQLECQNNLIEKQKLSNSQEKENLTTRIKEIKKQIKNLRIKRQEKEKMNIYLMSVDTKQSQKKESNIVILDKEDKQSSLEQGLYELQTKFNELLNSSSKTKNQQQKLSIRRQMSKTAELMKRTRQKIRQINSITS